MVYAAMAPGTRTAAARASSPSEPVAMNPRRNTAAASRRRPRVV
jgi:hypothetical protein